VCRQFWQITKKILFFVAIIGEINFLGPVDLLCTLIHQHSSLFSRRSSSCIFYCEIR